MARRKVETNVEEVVNQQEATVEETRATALAKPKKKKFEATETIPCVSITVGRLGMLGIKSGINYEWAFRGDVVDVEYQDLAAAVRSGKKQVFSPRFVIEDEDFLNEFPRVKKLYGNMYALNDLKGVIANLDAESMKATILTLPSGARDSIKGIASTMISTGELDSVSKIKVLDEIFDTKLMLMTELFG